MNPRAFHHLPSLPRILLYSHRYILARNSAFFPIFNIQLARTMNVRACNPSWSVKTRQRVKRAISSEITESFAPVHMDSGRKKETERGKKENKGKARKIEIRKSRKGCGGMCNDSILKSSSLNEMVAFRREFRGRYRDPDTFRVFVTFRPTTFPPKSILSRKDSI